MRKEWGRLRALLSLAHDDADVLNAQYRMFAKQIPLLYFILSVNTLAVIYTYAPYGHRWLGLYLPIALVALCVARGLVWWRRGDRDTSVEAAVRIMHSTIVLAAVLAAVFTAWGFTLYGYGDAYAKGQIVFFLGLTMIACVFSLTYLLPAALCVTAIGVGPFSVFFFFADEGRFRAVAVNLGFVAVGMVAAILRNYEQFGRRIASQRALDIQNGETLRLAQENSRLADLDPLTDLPNRRKFISSLNQLCDEAQAGEIAMAFVDLDGFKNVNDDYGHEAGDRLIVFTARALAFHLPHGASLARLGGDEFAACLAGVGAEGRMLDYIATVRASLMKPAPIGACSVRVEASIGVAAAEAGRCDARELLRRADVAMYQVKATGKGGVMLYEPSLDVARRRITLLNEEIRTGLDSGEFEMFYQPVVDADTKALTSVEALLRWPRRADGPLEPDVFIPAAEAAGAIDALGLFALRRACDDLRDLDGVQMSVNVSPAQFRDPGFEAKVARVLAETRFPAARLSLEVKEGYLIDNPERAAQAINALRALGASVVLDDFGSGYSSLAYLQKYRFSAVKLDRSLSSRVAVDDQSRVLVAGVVYLANGLNMPVTAEGVETEEQATLLRLAGCRYLQGYRYSKPKPIGDLMAEDIGVARALAG